jgi:hypothetical protein
MGNTVLLRRDEITLEVGFQTCPLEDPAFVGGKAEAHRPSWKLIIICVPQKLGIQFTNLLWCAHGAEQRRLHREMR